MTAPNREVFQNNADSTLNGAINNSVTSITVTDGSVFPSTGNFRILIEDEIITVTARSTHVLTVVRGQEGTAADSHSDSSVVTHILTADAVTRMAKDNNPMAGYAPALGRLVADNGTTLLTVSDFTWVNQDTAAATDQNGTIVMRAPTSASVEDVRLLTRTAPTAPYSYIAAFRVVMPLEASTDTAWFGIGFRESSTGEFIVLSLNSDSNGNLRRAVYAFTDATTFSTTYRSREHGMYVGPEVWLKIEDDNTDLIFYLGDGVEWIEIYSASRTAFMAGGPDQVFWSMNNYGNSFEGLARLCHWSRAS